MRDDSGPSNSIFRPEAIRSRPCRVSGDRRQFHSFESSSLVPCRFGLLRPSKSRRPKRARHRALVARRQPSFLRLKPPAGDLRIARPSKMSSLPSSSRATGRENAAEVISGSYSRLASCTNLPSRIPLASLLCCTADVLSLRTLFLIFISLVFVPDVFGKTGKG